MIEKFNKTEILTLLLDARNSNVGDHVQVSKHGNILLNFQGLLIKLSRGRPYD